MTKNAKFVSSLSSGESHCASQLHGGRWFWPCAGRSRGVSTRSQLGRVPHLLQIPAHWCCHFEIICFTIQACSFLENNPILVIAKDKHASHRKLANKYIRAITFSTIDKLSTPLVYSEYFDLCGANFGTVSLCLSTNTK